MNSKNQVKSKKLIAACLVILLGTFSLLKANQMKTTAVCRDVRLYMDGGYSAVIQSGGLTPKTTVTVFRKEGRKQINLGTLNVKPSTSKDKGVTTISYLGDKLNLTLSRTVKPHIQGNPALINGIFGSEKISAQMGCQNPTTKGS